MRDMTLVFTENPELDIIKIIKLYYNENRIGYMGYSEPSLDDFEFLGKKYKCISFWHDNEDIRDIDFTGIEILS